MSERKAHGGGRMPSVTTILNRFKESGALIQWAWRIGMSGKDLRGARELTVGSLVEHLIEDVLVGPLRPLPESASLAEVARATRSFEGFKRWADEHRVIVLEKQVALTSPKHRFAGKLHALALIDGQPAIVDWQAVGGVYVEHLLQLAAYRILLAERAEAEPHGTMNHVAVPERAVLVRIDKESGEVDPHTWPTETLALAGEMFLSLRRAYDLDRQLKEAV